jgi:hypothetical protein
MKEGQRVNMAAQAPDSIKDDDGNAWGWQWEPGCVHMDAGGVMAYIESGWIYRPGFKQISVGFNARKDTFHVAWEFSDGDVVPIERICTLTLKEAWELTHALLSAIERRPRDLEMHRGFEEWKLKEAEKDKLIDSQDAS